MNQLARVVDPEELSKGDGTRARLRIEVPASWAGAEIDVDVPNKLECACCDGGGCDRCDRSGAIRVSPVAPLRLHLPESLKQSVALRLARPFDDGPPDVLLVEITIAEVASARCRKIDRPAMLRRTARGLIDTAFVVSIVLAVLLVVALALSRC